MVKNPSASIGDVSLIPGLGRSPRGGNGNPLQCSCLENSHGQRSLGNCSPWGHKESVMTEHSAHSVFPQPLITTNLLSV